MSNVKKVNLAQTYTSDWELEFESGSNKVTAGLSYVDDFVDWFNRAPAIGSKHPDMPAILLKKIKTNRLDGDLIKVSLSFENKDPTATYPGRSPGTIKRYSLEPSLTEEPILRSSLFKDLDEDEAQALQTLISSSKTDTDYTTATSAVTSTTGIKAISKIRKGIEAFLNPGLIWVERYTTKNLSDLKLTEIRTTTSSPPGPCPSAGSDRNWLYFSGPANPNSDGNTWDIERKWQLSEEGKWDPDLYKAGTSP